MIRENENTVPCPYVICNFNGEEIIGPFFQNNCEKQIKQSLELRKDDKLYVKRKSYGNFVINWINKKKAI